jgi:glycosyltransferase involved in cell wall biosynthesis
LARLLSFLEFKLARLASLVIVNSQAGRRYAVQQGVPAKKLVVIPNGIDLAKFYPDATAREKMRTAWKVRPDELLIGIVGRIDPIKEHKIFLSAAAKLRHTHPQSRFVCVGESINRQYQEELYALTAALGLQQTVIWAGAHYDMLGAYNALDILTSASSSEGFSNVIGEAMACGVPCVVTNVGDSALIVGSSGLVVPVNDPAALLTGWLHCLRRQRNELGIQSQQRISKDFSVRAVVDRTEATLMAIV